MSEISEVLDNVSFVNEESVLKEFNYPLSFEFKIGTIYNDFVAKDSTGATIAYVRQKLFKLKEAVLVYSDESKKELLFTIKADRVIDFRANYAFTDSNGELFGRVGRKGMRSIWKAHYEIFDNNNSQDYHISELNPWAKVMDSLLGEIPVLNFFTGYLANPKYGLTDTKGEVVARLSKEPSFFGRKFSLEKLGNIGEGDGQRMILSLMMMMLLERRRG